MDWESLSEIEKKRMANLPAYLHYGVNTDEGVLMRKNNVPRSIANRLGELYSASVREKYSVNLHHLLLIDRSTKM